MQWTVRLEARTSRGEVTTTELVTFSRPVVVSTLAEVGLVLSDIKALLAKPQTSMLCGQVAEYAAHHRACVGCGTLQPLHDRCTRRLQTLFGTVEVEAPRFKACRCRRPVPMTGMTVSPAHHQGRFPKVVIRTVDAGTYGESMFPPSLNDATCPRYSSKLPLVAARNQQGR